MKWIIETLSHRPMDFTEQVPRRFAGPLLQGASLSWATGQFGDFIVQEFDGDDFFLRYTIIETVEPLIISAKSHHAGIHTLVMLRNNIRPSFRGSPPVFIGEGQFTILHAKQPESKIIFEGNQQYISFEAMLSDPLANELLRQIPEVPFSVGARAPNIPDIWISPAEWTDEEVRNYVHYILNYHDDEAWRRQYFANKVRDIFFRLLLLHNRSDQAAFSLTPDDKGKALATQQLIMDNLTRHLVISELAQQIGASESRLKKIFVRVFGMGMHEYRIQQRLKKAIELLLAGDSVKEAAAKTGWRSAELIKAYFKKYGTTPGTLKRRR